MIKLLILVFILNLFRKKKITPADVIAWVKVQCLNVKKYGYTIIRGKQ